MNKLIAPAAIAVVLSVSAAAYFSGVFQSEPSTKLTQNETLNMPKILLRPADSKECQRRRVLDGKGGAVDNVDMTDGSTKVVIFNQMPRVAKETTFYPAPDHKDCDAFTRDAVAVHGPIAAESVRDASGFKPVSETKYALNGKLVSAGKLIDKGDRFQTDFFGDAGLTTRSETYNLLTKSLESETLYRANGTPLVRQAMNPTETNFSKEHFSDDGKYVAWKETRSYGHYGIVQNYADGKPRVDASRGINYTSVTQYRPDGTEALMVQNWEYSIDVTVYNAAGQTMLQTKWKTDANGPKDAKGNHIFYLAYAVEVNDKGRPMRRFDFRQDGTVETVTLHKDLEFWKNRLEYTLDTSGRVVSLKPFDAKGDVMPVVNYAADPGLKFDLPDSYRVMPAFTIPEGLSAHDEKIKSEIQYSEH